VDDKAKKALVCFAIEQALLEMGGATLLDKVADLLLKNYQSSISDCYDHPEYLNMVLKLFGNNNNIAQSIKKQLDEFAYQEPTDQR
jgi:hypothetical protein